jgi:hypothetical protein
MKVWLGFLVVAMFLAGHEYRKQRPTRMIVLLILSALVTLAFRSYRFV